MTCLKRISPLGIPQHIIQRGNNRSACFFAKDDYRYFLDTLLEGCPGSGDQGGGTIVGLSTLAGFLASLSVKLGGS